MKTSVPPFEIVPADLPTNASARRCVVPFEQTSRRFLIMRLGGHGDVLMATPLIATLRHTFPDAWITWIVERGGRDAIDAHPNVDDVLLWSGSAWKTWLRLGLFPVWLNWAIRLRAMLKRRRYDTFISFQPEEWPLLTRAVGAKTNIGVFDTFRQFNSGKATSRNTRLFTTAFRHPDLPEHRTDQYLLPLRALGVAAPSDKAMSFGYTRADEASVTEFLGNEGVAPCERFVVIAPMTTWPTRCWDGARYSELGNALGQHLNVRMVLIGSPSERPAVEAIARDFARPPIVAAGSLSFRQLGALIARSSLLISGDTGPMHLAAAVGTPYVALFGPTPVLGRAPLAGRGLSLAHAVPCGPCDQKRCSNPPETQMLCMKLLTVDEVFRAAQSYLIGVSTRE
jgi:ADP-heptose:LPS heptosyltransferase